MEFEEQEKILKYLAQRENERFCHLLAEKLSNAGIRVKLNFKIETMEEIKKDGIHLEYRPVHCLDDVIVDFEEHDKKVREKLMKELLEKATKVEGHGIR